MIHFDTIRVKMGFLFFMKYKHTAVPVKVEFNHDKYVPSP